ncbi:MAG: N-formylglutamate amidohydrolase [Planktotalea sp.]|uniref:N-formylglutamate amidohydrolase n=1 Tax=Planktotalea sp. TaxID=2029877 RepID=UPI003C712B6B
MTYQPYFEYGTDRTSRWTVTSDHAANTVPDFVNAGDLGLDPQHMDRHIAYDIGAEGLARALGELLNGPVICSNFSRLVIDPNRGIDDPTLLMKLYDGTIIPANRHAGAAELSQRLEACYHPYHNALGTLMQRRADPVLLSIHSFTPQLQGRPKRPWEIGVLYAHDDRLARPLLDVLCEQGDLTVGDNEPYLGHLPGDAVDRHALANGHLNVLIELRNDLIETPEQQNAWAARLAPLLETALERTNL